MTPFSHSAKFANACFSRARQAATGRVRPIADNSNWRLAHKRTQVNGARRLDGRRIAGKTAGLASAGGVEEAAVIIGGGAHDDNRVLCRMQSGHTNLATLSGD